LGYTKSQGGMSLAGFMLAMIIGRTVGAFVAERVRGVTVLRSACIGFTILCIFGGLAPGSVMPLAACVTSGVVLGALWPTTLGIVADRFPQGGASLFALLSASGNTGCVVMPWIVGIVAEKSGLHTAIASVSSATIVILVLLAVFAGRTGAQRPAPTG
jgi:fucose permease